jgi:hypothetical protein
MNNKETRLTVSPFLGLGDAECEACALVGGNVAEGGAGPFLGAGTTYKTHTRTHQKKEHRTEHPKRATKKKRIRTHPIVSEKKTGITGVKAFALGFGRNDDACAFSCFAASVFGDIGGTCSPLVVFAFAFTAPFAVAASTLSPLFRRALGGTFLPCLAAKQLNAHASSFRPNPKANAFTPVIPGLFFADDGMCSDPFFLVALFWMFFSVFRVSFFGGCVLCFLGCSSAQERPGSALGDAAADQRAYLALRVAQAQER